MSGSPRTGTIIALNGMPRAGKSSLVRAIQDSFDGVWMNVGLDRCKAMTPEHLQPGIGLRPGGERPDLEPLVVALYQAMYASAVAHARVGVDVVMDVGHHDAYSRPLGILPACARIVAGFDAWFIGVRPPVDVVMRRRRDTWGDDVTDVDMVERVRRWDVQVHTPGRYDLQVDTSIGTPAEGAQRIRAHLDSGAAPAAFAHLAGG